MPKFPINSNQINNNMVKISGDDYKHIVKVLRYKKGKKIELFDQNSTSYQAVITHISSKEISARIFDNKTINTESGLTINLFQSIPKGSKMDLIIQKSGELGLGTLTPVYTERTIVRSTNKLDRWNKISQETCKQSGRSKPLVINPPESFPEILKKLSGNDINILFYEESKNDLKRFLMNKGPVNSEVNILIGPEGGFTAEEIAKAENNGVNILGLGPRTLRTETAAIAAVSIIQFYFGDI